MNRVALVIGNAQYKYVAKLYPPNNPAPCRIEETMVK